jgi:small subunit ribosomal protein S21
MEWHTYVACTLTSHVLQYRLAPDTAAALPHWQGNASGAQMPLRMRVHDREHIGAALRRFKKLLERSGLTKELRKRKHYVTPSEERRRASARKASAIRKVKNLAAGGAYR